MNTTASFSFPNQFIGSRVSGQQPLQISGAYSKASTTRIASQQASHYEVLGIELGATSREIKSAYRRLARVLHPDVIAYNTSTDHTSAAAQDFITVQKAYAALCDPEKRFDYDRTLLFRRGRTVHSASALSAATTTGYTPRTWETDQCW